MNWGSNILSTGIVFVLILSVGIFIRPNSYPYHHHYLTWRTFVENISNRSVNDVLCNVYFDKNTVEQSQMISLVTGKASALVTVRSVFQLKPFASPIMRDLLHGMMIGAIALGTNIGIYWLMCENCRFSWMVPW